MSTPTILRYALDPTGTSVNNLVQGELHELPARTVRAIATQYGAFFSESLQVRDLATNQLLTRDVQYQAAELYELPTARYGKEICAIILILDASVSSNVSVQYQALGGEFSTSQTAIIQQIENLALDNRPAQWGSVIDKPSAYPPSYHLHDIGDVYGFEYVVHALDRIRAAIEMGDSASHDAIYSYIDLSTAGLAAADTLNLQNLNAHINNKTNPHQVTAAQLGVYTIAQVDALLSSNNGGLAATVTSHINNTNNPHATTKTHVGLSNVPNYTMASTAQAIAGTEAAAFMSPALTTQALATHSASTSTAHDGRYKPYNAAGTDGSFVVSGNQLYCWIAGAWQLVWPPQWQA